VAHGEVVTTSKELSIRLAKLASDIRNRIKSALDIETDRGPLTKLMKAFQTSLVHDLDARGFADMYAQTIAYGLLSARIANPHQRTVDDFAGHMRTNPFLRELMETFLTVGGRRGKAGGPGIDFDELGVSEVVQLLDDANMEAVVRDFGDKNPQEDPVTHFYEGFATEYDPIDKVRRGEFYTPRPVVSYIVRSVDELLRTEFSLADGLADITTWGEMTTRHKDLKIPEGVSPGQAFVQILDPATGTGTFLVEAIDLIYKTLVAKWRVQAHDEKKIEVLWNSYVPTHLLPRLHAYELKMAPYAIAHLKIGLKLYETGYRFGSDERARIYLTNALEPPQDFSGTFEFAIPALAHEAQAVNEIKRKQRFTVVVGNPPYSGISSNMSEQAQRIVDAYRFADGAPLNEKKVWLQDDYVKFIRMAQTTIDRADVGILGYITNHGYLDNPTFRGMRQSLMGTFLRLFVLDLHGNANKSEQSPDGSEDKNVFDIRQGVAICVGRRGGLGVSVEHVDLWGGRDVKYAWLATHDVGNSGSSILTPNTPYYFFEPQALVSDPIYEAAMPVDQIFPLGNSGIVTARDGLVLDLDLSALQERIAQFRNPKLSDSEITARFELSENYMWRVSDARKQLMAVKDCEPFFAELLYRPFNTRHIFFHPSVVWRTRMDVMGQLQHGNLALITTRQTRDPFGALATRLIVGHKSVAAYDINSVFPLYVFSANGGQRGLHSLPDRTPNLAPSFLKALAGALRVPQTGASGGLPQGLTPEDIFHYGYAVLHSPGYRGRYAEFLKIEYPRLPLPGSLDLFRDLARRGSELVALHLMESTKLDHPFTIYTGPKKPEVGRVGWSDDTVWLDAAATVKGQPATPGTIGFRGVPKVVWNFHIGGYQVCDKWLKDRKGRTLSKDDLAHYQKIVIALAETIRLMQEIDVVIEQHGGWPGAFVKGDKVQAARSEASAVVTPMLPAEGRHHEYQTAAQPLRKVAEPKAPVHEPIVKIGHGRTRPDPDELHREDLVCRIRQLFGEGDERARESALAALARDLGYQRTGTRIHEELDNALRTAVRRRVLANEHGALRLFARTIEQYDRDLLKEQFLASLAGGQWVERDDAIRNFARWMGFRRTGPAIDDTARSLLNGLLREERLERDGSRIRRTG
jgi:Type ISP C-terminal specificity domain